MHSVPVCHFAQIIPSAYSRAVFLTCVVLSRFRQSVAVWNQYFHHANTSLGCCLTHMAASSALTDEKTTKIDKTAPFKLLYSINGFISTPACVANASAKRQKLTAGFAQLRVNGPGNVNVWAADRSKLPADPNEADEFLVRWWADQQTKPENVERIAAGQLGPEGADYVNQLRHPPAQAEGGYHDVPNFDALDLTSEVLIRFFGQLGSGFDAFCGSAAAAAVRDAGSTLPNMRSVPLLTDGTVDFSHALMREASCDFLAGAPQAVQDRLLEGGVSPKATAAVRQWQPAAAAQELQDTLNGCVWNAWFAEDVSSMQIQRVLGLTDNGSNRFCTSLFVLHTERRVYVVDLYAP